MSFPFWARYTFSLISMLFGSSIIKSVSSESVILSYLRTKRFCPFLMNAPQQGLTEEEASAFLRAIFKPIIIIIVRKSSSVGAAACGSGRQQQQRLHGPFFNPAAPEGGSVKGRKGGTQTTT